LYALTRNAYVVPASRLVSVRLDAVMFPDVDTAVVKFRLEYDTSYTVQPGFPFADHDSVTELEYTAVKTLDAGGIAYV
jgi:hypothetical protein